MKSYTMFAIALCCGCTSNDLLPLTVSGEDFASGPVHVAVTQTALNESVACDSTTVVDGAFAIDLGRVVQPNVGHRIDAYVDLDGDARCEFGVDAVVSMSMEPTTEGNSVGFSNGRQRVGDDPTGCTGFGGLSLRLKVVDVATDVVRYALVRTNADGTTLDKVVSIGWAIADHGVVTIDLPGALQRGRAYQLDFFEATTIDTACAADTPVHRVWRSADGTDDPIGCLSSSSSAETVGSVATNDFFDGDCRGFTKP